MSKAITVHIPDEMEERLNHLAERLDRSSGWVIEHALSEFVALEEEKHRMTLEGITDADAGRLVEHDDVVAWLNSWGTDHERHPPSCG